MIPICMRLRTYVGALLTTPANTDSLITFSPSVFWMMIKYSQGTTLFVRPQHSRMHRFVLYLSAFFVTVSQAFLQNAGAQRRSLSYKYCETFIEALSEEESDDQGRRAFLRRSSALIAPLLTSTLILSTDVKNSYAAEDEQIMNSDEELIDVYFGCGCFWHVQHEFVEAERNILGRSDEQLTARAGYAGAKSPGQDKNGRVCYHNGANIADYGALGHAEVVSLKIPSSQFQTFAVEYCKLFKNGMRPDQFGDKGPEYRNLVGIPGGTKSPLAQELVKASIATSDQLDFAKGKGNDEDVARLVWIMDTNSYPFYVGEQYHQFHDGFNFGENYPNSYNSLAKTFANKGENFGSCPNGMIGLGFGGL